MKKTLILTTVLLVSILSIFINKLYFQPVATVVPHHNVVADRRMDMLKVIKKKRLTTTRVIVLSPDHFSNDQKSIYYSDRDWEFKDFKLYFDDEYDADPSFKLDNNLVKNDHGVFNVLSDVGVVWPNAKVVPILIGQKVKFENLDNLVRNLKLNCGYNCLLVASVDFSHYLPYKLADIHDQESIQALTNLDLKIETQIEADSPQSIYVLINFSKNKKTYEFTLFDHTNSAKLVGAEDTESTSHIFGWYQKNLFKRIEKYDVRTFTYVNKLSKKDNLKSLGERFFYGVDDINLENDKVPENFVLAGFEKNGKLEKVYFPLICEEKVCVFAKGEEKKRLLPEIAK